jgi:glutamyl-tRNA reductase
VKQLDADHRHARLQLMRELFGLEDAAPAEPAEGGEVRALRRP